MGHADSSELAPRAPAYRELTAFYAFRTLGAAWSAQIQRRHPSARSSPDGGQPTLVATARHVVRTRCANNIGCQAARRRRCTRRDCWHGTQASAAKRAHLGRSLVSSSARVRAAEASGPPDELAPRARAGGAGWIARLQVPDDRALSVHVALRRAGSLLHVTAQDCGDVVLRWWPTKACKTSCDLARERTRQRPAHSSCRASTASHTALRSPWLLGQPGGHVSRRLRSYCAQKRVGLRAAGVYRTLRSWAVRGLPPRTKELLRPESSRSSSRQKQRSAAGSAAKEERRSGGSVKGTRDVRGAPRAR
jgi:hypothetical protein